MKADPTGATGRPANQDKAERRHLDNVCTGVMTIATIVIVGMFAILQTANELGTDRSGLLGILSNAIIPIAISAVASYVWCMTFGCLSMLSACVREKQKNLQLLIIAFLTQGFLVSIMAALAIMSNLEPVGQQGLLL